MLLKIHFLQLHVSFFPENLVTVNDDQGGLILQDTTKGNNGVKEGECRLCGAIMAGISVVKMKLPIKRRKNCSIL
jgi:hypothetical protein